MLCLGISWTVCGSGVTCDGDLSGPSALFQLNYTRKLDTINKVRSESTDAHGDGITNAGSQDGRLADEEDDRSSVSGSWVNTVGHRRVNSTNSLSSVHKSRSQNVLAS